MVKKDVSTPPPFTIQTPRTPQFGFYDDYQHDSPRRSIRIAQRHQYDKNIFPCQPSTRYSRKNCPLSTHLTVTVLPGNLSSPATPQIASMHIKKNVLESKREEIPGVQLFSPATKLSQSSYQNISSNVKESSHVFSSTICNNGMLPTPAKTPSKRPQTPSRSIKAVARNIFADQSGSKEGQGQGKERHDLEFPTTISDGFLKEDRPKSFTIFTDPHDRIPEKEVCPDNPFYIDSSSKPPEQTKRYSKRRRIMVPGEGLQLIEDLKKREDGLIYIFRGKPIFRKFDEFSHTLMDEYNSSLGGNTLISTPHRPLTRSSIKPRLLFTVKSKPQIQSSLLQDTEDEEANTDIEDSILSTPKVTSKAYITTPKATSFMPVSPPTTFRTSRTKKLEIKMPPITPGDEDNIGLISPTTRVTRTGGDDKRFYPFHPTESLAEKHPRKRPSEQVIQPSINKKFRLCGSKWP